MTKSKFSPNQIVKILKEWESGAGIESVSRTHGVSKPMPYSWRKKYSGMEIGDLKRLKVLEEENAKLKRMYAELVLDHELAKEIISKTK